MNCMSCKFAADKDKGALKCHRYPRPVIKSRDGWCGEFSQEEKVKKAIKNEKQQ